MGLRKYKELEEYPKLRVLKRPGDKSNGNIRSFVTLILIVGVIVSSIVILNSSDEPEKEETLQDFVERAIESDGQKNEKFTLGKTTPKQNEKIKKLLDIDVSNYQWVIGSGDVRHIWKKPAHGIGINEILKIYTILNTYDFFEQTKKHRKDILSIEIYKDFEYRLTCIVEVRTGKKELVVITMYKNKLK